MAVTGEPTRGSPPGPGRSAGRAGESTRGSPPGPGHSAGRAGARQPTTRVSLYGDVFPPILKSYLSFTFLLNREIPYQVSRF